MGNVVRLSQMITSIAENLTIKPIRSTASLPRPMWGEADVRPRAAGEGPNFLKILKLLS